MSIRTMKKRLQYHGGSSQQARMNIDKLKSLKRAMQYSYQAATAILPDGREFRCLINPNKLSPDLDNKILSIPFKDVCLNRRYEPDAPCYEGDWEDMEELYTKEYQSLNEKAPREIYKNPVCGRKVVATGIKEGDVIEWKETKSHWIVLLQHLEETAYFRADLRRCRYEVEFEDGSKHWAYIRGPVEQTMVWAQKSGDYYNKLNYTLLMYISQTKENLEYFHRFTKVIINSEPWEVQAVDSISTPGIIEVALKETFNNTIEKDSDEAVYKIEQKRENEEPIYEDRPEVFIYGKEEVYPYDNLTYFIENYAGAPGAWSIENESRKGMVKVVSSGFMSIEINIITGRSGSFSLVYRVDEEPIAALDITVLSL